MTARLVYWFWRSPHWCVVIYHLWTTQIIVLCGNTRFVWNMYVLQVVCSSKDFLFILGTVKWLHDMTGTANDVLLSVLDIASIISSGAGPLLCRLFLKWKWLKTHFEFFDLHEWEWNVTRVSDATRPHLTSSALLYTRLQSPAARFKMSLFSTVFDNCLVFWFVIHQQNK